MTYILSFFAVLASLGVAYVLILGAWHLLIFIVKAIFDKPLKNSSILLLVASIISSPFVYTYIEEEKKKQRSSEYQKKRDLENAQYAYSEKGLMSCVKSFNKQFFLAPAWKKSLAKGHSATVDVFKYSHELGKMYFFIVPEALKKRPVFWVNADVPHFITYKGDGPFYSIDEAHFQKGQYMDKRYRYNSVSCNPVSSDNGSMLIAEMYYIVFDGSFTAEDYARHWDKLRASGYNHSKAGIRFRRKNLGKGELFEETMLTPESLVIEKVYSMKL